MCKKKVQTVNKHIQIGSLFLNVKYFVLNFTNIKGREKLERGRDSDSGLGLGLPLRSTTVVHY